MKQAIPARPAHRDLISWKVESIPNGRGLYRDGSPACDHVAVFTYPDGVVRRLSDEHSEPRWSEMKQPMQDKTPEMRAAIESLFPGTAQALAEHRCPICRGPIGEFSDALSQREYEISGLCQRCQDETFA